MKSLFPVILIISFLLSGCRYYNRFWSHQEIHIASVNNNVCKKLSDKVVVYAIFVDSKYTGTWTEHDMNSTLDSIRTAMHWLENQAAENGIKLSVEVDYHQNKQRVIPIEGRLTKKTLSATLLTINGVNLVDRWADKIGREALKTFGPDRSSTTNTKIKPKDRERLIARIRDEHKTDNVALMYFINNYYTDEISCALHCSSDTDPEYAVVSYKQPPVIAHEFLHLFGAWDLYITPFDNKRKAQKRKAFAMEEFPNEIMAFPYRRLDSLQMSQFTKYLIGWENELDEHYEKMLIGNKFEIAKY